jgi:hypothetical protein
MELSKRDRDVLEHLEEELWREETRFDHGRMGEVITPEFLEFGRSGRVYQREDTLAIPRGPIDAVIPLPDFRARLLHPDVAQVTYNSAVRYGGVVSAPGGARSGHALRTGGCCDSIKARPTTRNQDAAT